MADETINGNAELDPSALDWVAERAACSLPIIFNTLRKDVGEDVRARNALRPADATFEFRVEDGTDRFSVVLQAADFQRSVTFSLDDHVILVLDPSGNQMFDIQVSFNDQGKCRIKAKEENREPWQVRRMALEDLMFRLV